MVNGGFPGGVWQPATGKAVKAEEAVASKQVAVQSKGLMVRGACPICGGILSHEEGCVTCHSCGYSECS